MAEDGRGGAAERARRVWFHAWPFSASLRLVATEATHPHGAVLTHIKFCFGLGECF